MTSASALILRFGRIGDLLALTPALRALRGALPRATLELVTTPTGAATLAGNPHLDHIHTLRWRRFPHWINPEKAKLVSLLRDRAFDMAFVFETARRYHALLEPLDIPTVYAFTTEPDADPNRLRLEPGLHMAENCKRLLDRAGVPHAGWHYDFPVGASARERARKLLRQRAVPQNTVLVGVHAGQFQRRRRWRLKTPAKAWPPERFAGVIRRLAERVPGLRAALTGTAAESTLAAAIAEELPDDDLSVDLTGATDLQTLGAVIQGCRLFISLDTGPAHIAAAVDTPLVVLFGPTPPSVMGPLGDQNKIEYVYREALGEGARHGYHPRMWAIEAEDVLQAVDRLDPDLGRSQDATA